MQNNFLGTLCLTELCFDGEIKTLTAIELFVPTDTEAELGDVHLVQIDENQTEGDANSSRSFNALNSAEIGRPTLDRA